MKTITVTAKKLDSFFKIVDNVLMALAIAAGVCTGLILIAWLFGLDPDTIATGYASLDIGFLELEVANAYAPNKWMVLLQAAVTLVLSAGFCLIARGGVRCIRNILLPVTQGKPFSDAVIENLKKLAILSIVLGILGNVISLVEMLFTTFVFDVTSLLISEKITHVSLNYTSDIGFVVISAVLLLLSYIFRYGSELQQLSDETL